MSRIGASSGNNNPQAVSGVPPTDINAIARWDNTDGTLIKNSPGTFVQDSGAINAQAFVFNKQILNEVVVPNHFAVVSSDIEILTGDLVLLGDSDLILL